MKAIGTVVEYSAMYFRYQNTRGQEFRTLKQNTNGLNDDAGEHYNYVGPEQDRYVKTVFAIDNTSVSKVDWEKVQNDYARLRLFRFVGNVGGNGRRYRNGLGEERTTYSPQALGNEELGSSAVFNGLTLGSGLWERGAEEATVYRVFGGDARAEGFSWTTTHPNSVEDFRNLAGLPSGGASGATNTAEFMLEGKVNVNNIIKFRKALPLDGNVGGLSEYIIDPQNIRITNFSILKP